MSVELFINDLAAYRSANDVFNPWGSLHDPLYDLPDASSRRKNNLKKYLEQRVPNADYIFVAEALGYQGGRFSGIAMTSERILAGKYRSIPPSAVFSLDTDFEYLRSSNPDLELGARVRKRFGFAEPTATTVWNTIFALGLHPNQVILWNIFPFHPYKMNEGGLSNRSLDIVSDDLLTGISFVQKLLQMNPRAKLIAIGIPSKTKLDEYNISCYTVPHPSKGGTPEFKQALRETIEQLRD
ncbi:uracil-DNA glycosylase [Paenibacillus sp. HJGM_3]|uniref:uracil-DNA glycosylase n=1 Tax=Paenibacillus sp. HJGM_3 TaxID=3379816 RepID=UPI0038580889